MTGCYLLHFAIRLRHAGHYLGYADDIDARLKQHKIGRGGRLPAVCRERGISFSVVRTWPDTDRAHERKLKNRHSGVRLCPVCRAAAKGAKP